MYVKVKLLGILADKLKVQDLNVELEKGATLRDLIVKLVDTLGEKARALLLDEKGHPRKLYNVLINGLEHEALNGLDTALSEGDTVSIIPLAGGG